MRGWFLLVGFVCSIFVTFAFSSRSAARVDVEYPAPLVREQRRVVVNGAPEVWTLKWRSRPKPECGPEQGALMCPCMGFAYGETGDLDLIRTRDGALVDQLHVTPL